MFNQTFTNQAESNNQIPVSPEQLPRVDLFRCSIFTILYDYNIWTTCKSLLLTVIIIGMAMCTTLSYL